jgi:hypothetical protein
MSDLPLVSMNQEYTLSVSMKELSQRTIVGMGVI